MPRSTKPIARRTPLRARPSHRARPDEPLATWCEAHLRDCTGRATDRHHRLPRAQGGGDEAANTIDVCRSCHIDGIHGHPAEAYALGLLRRKAAA
jgi:hypothetical protein